MEILCQETGYKAVLNFKPCSWTSKDLHRVEGFIYDNKLTINFCDEFILMILIYRKNKIKALYGYWTHCFYSCDIKTYEDYLKSNKVIPTVNIDACLKPKLQTTLSSTKPFVSPSTNPIKQSYSESALNNQYKEMEEDSYESSSSPSTSIPGSSELWRANSMPENSSQYYNVNYFSMCLNELKDEYIGVIAQTDSRFRSDIRSLENCDLGKSNVQMMI